MPPIPYELYRLIVAEVEETSTLMALRLASRNFCYEANHRLFKDMKFGYSPNGTQQRQQQQQQKKKPKRLEKEGFLIFKAFPRLGPCLVHLDLEHLHDGLISHNVWTDFLIIAGQVCSNLKILKCPPFQSYDEPARYIPPHNSIFKLHTFSFPWPKKRVPNEATRLALCCFLKSQPEIEHLELAWLGFDIHHSLTHHSLPKLRILSSTISVCSGLIVGRPVEEIHITETGLLQIAPLMKEFAQHPHFKRLELHLCLIAMLPLFRDCLGKLESLSVCIVRVSSAPSFSPRISNLLIFIFLQTQRGDLAILMDTLPKMKKLHSLNIHTKSFPFTCRILDGDGDGNLLFSPRINDLLNNSRREILTKCPLLQDSQLRIFLGVPL